MSAAPSDDAKARAAHLCGFLNVLKPPGMSSAQVVGRVRWLLGGAKVGHAGTLDPEAAGVLPLMVGKAARLFDYLQEKEKTYVTEVAFGCSTDTQDAQGTVLEEGARCPDDDAIRAALPGFVGPGTQIPPMYSALKKDGERLYDLARKGKSVEMEPRPVTVHSLEWIAPMERHGALLRVRCSKGFYVRTLCHDLGATLGCPAHMRFLLRTQSGPFTLDTARTLEELQRASEAGEMESLLLPLESALGHLPMADVPPTLEKQLRNGVPLPVGAFPSIEQDRAPFGMRLNGRLTAIGERENRQVRVRTWLGE
ncbi:MAG: tRNA pseudouridine(55) synthase TruB [Eubacteriales bacterium]|nr:tRNA pseudouridine(55) synthase TruB [Eubacteriales bacterium]